MSQWTEENRKKPKRSRCGASAKNREGRPCQNYAMPNGRCRLHGGKTGTPPKGNKRALKHGIYYVGVLEEEKEILPHIKLGTLDEEILMLKLKLRRTWNAQRMWLEQRGRIESEVIHEGRRLIRSLSELEESLASKHLPVSHIERSESLVHDQEGNPHTNRSTKIIRRKTDYSLEIKQLSNLISRLELQRKELLEESEDTVKDLVKQFKEFADDAVGTLPGGEM